MLAFRAVTPIIEFLEFLRTFVLVLNSTKLFLLDSNSLVGTEKIWSPSIKLYLRASLVSRLGWTDWRVCVKRAKPCENLDIDLAFEYCLDQLLDT